MVNPKSVKPIRTAKIGYIVMSLALCALGVTLIVSPEISSAVLGTVMGIIMIVFGAVKLVGYFSKDLFRLAFQYDLAFGILMITLGVIVLLKPDNVLNFICIVLGISALADGLFKIQISIDSKSFGIRQWWMILICAIAAGAVGIVLIFRPTESTQILMILFGISLLTEGILNLSTVLTAVKIVRHQVPDTIEADFEESED